MPVDPIKLMRKQVDELLGPNRNGDRPRLPVTHYSDPRLCRYDLAGLCPYKLFPNTKQHMGPCTYEICPVPERWKRQYEQEATERDRSDTDRELMRLLERLVRDCDDRISRANRRLEQQQRTPQAASSTLPDGPGGDSDAVSAAGGAGGDASTGMGGDDELKTIAEELEQLTSRVGELGSMGEIDKAQELTERIEELTQRKDAIERVRAMHQQQQQNPQHQHHHHGGGKEQQLLVCDICAAYLSVNESAQRLADHFSGKMHVGFQLVRDKLREIREKGSGGGYSSGSSSRYHPRSYHGGSGADGDRYGDSSSRGSHYGSSDRRDGGRYDGRYGDRDRDRYGESSLSRGGYYGSSGRRDGGRYDDRDRDRYSSRDRERYRGDDRYNGSPSSRRYDSGSNGRSGRSRSPFSERNGGSGGVRKSSHSMRRSLSRSRSRSVGRY